MVRSVLFDQSFEIWSSLEKESAIVAPFFSFDWHRVWYETQATGFTPLVLVSDEQVLLPLCVRGSEVFFSGGKETSDYLDAVGNKEYFAQAWSQSIEYLKKHGYSKLMLDNVPEGKTTDYFRTIGAHILQEDTTPLIALPNSFEEYVSSLPRKWRKELKRKMKNFERDNQGVYFEEEGSLDCLISLMKKNHEKKAFFEQDHMEHYFRRIFESFPQSAKIRCLSVRGNLAASIYYFETPDSYLLYNSGFDKENYDSAGLYLKVLGIKKAIEQGKKTYNFLQGSERYKYELGGVDFFVYSISLNLS